MTADGRAARSGQPRRRSWPRPGQGTLVIPPLLFVVVLLLLPVAFVGLYSVGLRTNIPGTPTAFSLLDWKDFLTGGGSAFRSRETRRCRAFVASAGGCSPQIQSTSVAG